MTLPVQGIVIWVTEKAIETNLRRVSAGLVDHQVNGFDMYAVENRVF